LPYGCVKSGATDEIVDARASARRRADVASDRKAVVQSDALVGTLDAALGSLGDGARPRVRRGSWPARTRVVVVDLDMYRRGAARARSDAYVTLRRTSCEVKLKERCVTRRRHVFARSHAAGARRWFWAVLVLFLVAIVCVVASVMVYI
jgi:hypothetical protein